MVMLMFDAIAAAAAHFHTREVDAAQFHTAEVDDCSLVELVA